MKTKAMFLGWFALGLLSCSGNDNVAPSVTEAQLVGKWEIYSTDRTVSGHALAPILYQHECPSSPDYIEFEVGGGFNWVEHTPDCGVSAGSFLDAGWSLSGNRVTFSGMVEGEPLKVAVDETELILTSDWVRNGTRFRESRRFTKVDQ